MKKARLLLLLILGSLLCQAQSSLTPSLSEAMSKSEDNEPIEVIVQMKAHYNRSQLCRQADFIPTKAERRAFVVNELKRFSEASQYDLRGILSEMEKQGMVTGVCSLWSANAMYFKATKEAILYLSERTDIECISLNKQYQWIPDAGMAAEASDLREIVPNIIQVNADQVWAMGNTGQDVVVAVIDSGVNYNHMDLADHLWDGGKEFPHHGYDIVNDDDDPMDDLGHGTHCAGTVCGDGTAGLSTGIAPDAKLMCIKSIDSNGYGGATNIAGGLEWAVEHGCDAISMSLGMANAEAADKELLRLTCQAILDAGIIAVVCTGNEGHLQYLCPIPNNVRVPASCPPPYLDPDQMENPGGLSCVLAVGAVESNDTAAYFTSQGPVTWQDTKFGDYAYDPGIGLIRPDVCAPGVNIWSLTYNHNNSYDVMTGTSQATPCVAGIVALMLHKNPDLTPAQICQILEETSVKLTPNKSNITGLGRVDALAAVNAVPEWDDAVFEQHQNQALVFPNPSQDAFTVRCEGMTQIEIYSVDGKMVRHVNTNGSECVLNGLPEGVFLMKISTRDGFVFKRIIKLS